MKFFIRTKPSGRNDPWTGFADSPTADSIHSVMGNDHGDGCSILANAKARRSRRISPRFYVHRRN